ncbi:hypothetical protein D9M71_166620 [compost metagenome]
MVAAITRQSTAMLWFEPRRSRVRSCKTRSNFICRLIGMLSTSSRNSVPPLACSILPMRRLPAPVKALASWPKISLSNRFSGRPPQFRATNGCAWRLLKSCRQRATSSLPVPVSPSISTLAEVSATLAINSRRFCMAGERPMMRPSRELRSASCRRKEKTSRARLRCSRARRTTSTRRSGEKGFSMKS